MSQFPFGPPPGGGQPGFGGPPQGQPGFGGPPQGQPGFGGPPPQGQYPQNGYPQNGGQPQNGYPQNGGQPQNGYGQGYPVQGAGPYGMQMGQPANPQQNVNPFFELNGADPTGTNLPFLLAEPGAGSYYLLEIDKILMKESRQKRKLLFIIELTILDSTHPERPSGMRCSAMIDMSNTDTRSKHLKRLIASVLSSDPTLEIHKGPVAPDGQPWDTHAVAAISEQQPWRKRRIGCHSHNIETRSGDDFTVNDWLPFEMAIPMVQAGKMRRGAPGQPQHSVGASSGMSQPPGAPTGYPPNGAGGYGAPGGYGPQQGFGGPQQQQPGFGPPPQQQQPGFGPPPQQQQQPGYGGPPGQPGWPQWGG